jgi:hypothetical protein
MTRRGAATPGGRSATQADALRSEDVARSPHLFSCRTGGFTNWRTAEALPAAHHQAIEARLEIVIKISVPVLRKMLALLRYPSKKYIPAPVGLCGGVLLHGPSAGSAGIVELLLKAACTTKDLAYARCRSAEIARDRYVLLCLNLTFRHFRRTL